MTRTILFVCTANRFRSPIAAASLTREIHHHEQDEDLLASSAGTWTWHGQPATPEAIQYGEEHQIDLGHHRSRPISYELLSQSDLVLTMTSGQMESLRIEFPKFRDRIKMFSEAAGFPPFEIPDPYVENYPPKDVADEIVRIIHKGYDKVVNLAIKKEDKSDSEI